MSPQDILQHLDRATLWPARETNAAWADVAAAYQAALAVRALRIARGERPVGYKIGFTNRTIWQRYGVFAPIWGTVWHGTLQVCDGEGRSALTHLCQPRLEPEIVFGIAATPSANASLDQMFDCVDWLAPGFEIVQSHHAGWKFSAGEAVADGSLHGRLLVGPARRCATSRPARWRSMNGWRPPACGCAGTTRWSSRAAVPTCSTARCTRCVTPRWTRA